MAESINHLSVSGMQEKQEDFSSLVHKTSATHGRDFKYTGNYEDAASLLRSNVAVGKCK